MSTSCRKAMIYIYFSARRTIVNAVSNADTIIALYEASFGELRIEFIMGSTLQTALTTVRILEKVENIGMFPFI